jgi:hypothetical protein
LPATFAAGRLDRPLASPVGKLTNGVDQFTAGIANVVSGGITNQLREALYGETATKNHQGTFYNIGSLLGFGINLGLMLVNPCNASRLAGTGVRALNLLQGTSNAKDAYDRYQAGDYLGAARSAFFALLDFAQFGRTCFAAGTPLLTPDGSKYIEDFRVGDLILSRDENDPEAPIVTRRVVNLFRNYSPLLDLHVGGRVIRTTAEHPFWVVGRGWVAAHQIEAGDLLIGAEGEQTAVESIDGPSEPAPVYNLMVEDYHTYLVGSAFWGFSVWAHNANSYPDAPKGAAPNLEQVAQGVKAAGKYDATVGSLDEARQVIGKAMPGAVELPPAVAGQPYASPPPGVKKWFQVQPAEPNVGNMQPHIKYADWTQGRKGTGGSWGHIFFPE